MKYLTANGYTEVDEDTFYVICNGPSLKGFDFNVLKGKPTIGMNAAYRMFEKINFWPKNDIRKC